LRACLRRRGVWTAGRLSDRSLGAAASPYLEYFAVCLRGVLRGIFDQYLYAAIFPLLRVHWGLRGIRGGGGLAGGTLSQSGAARESARLYPGVFFGRRFADSRGLRNRRQLRSELSGTQ